LKKLEETLNLMEKMGVIEKVDEPTDWCSGLVLVPKPDGSIRVCVDYAFLNPNVEREIFPMPNAENFFARAEKAAVFSKLDANHGFWQCPLDQRHATL